MRQAPGKPREILAINLDAICDEADGESGRVVAFGCIGKLLLSALVIGVESHAAYPLAGVNAAYLAAELTAEMEFAPELGEDAGGHGGEECDAVLHRVERGGEPVHAGLVHLHEGDAAPRQVRRHP